MERPRREPAFLFVVLLGAVVALLTAWLGVRAGLAGLGARPSASEREAAVQAADLGLQYALARLQADPAWRGNSRGPAPVLANGLSVVEEGGNVVGLLHPPKGPAAHFRLSFNLQDGSGGPDVLDDTPQGRLRLEVGRVSLNNLLGRGPLVVPGQESLPRGSAYLAVEGLSGPGLMHPVQTGASVARRVLQAWCTWEPTGVNEPAEPPVLRPRGLDGADLGFDSHQSGQRQVGGGPAGDFYLGRRGGAGLEVRPSASEGRDDSRGPFSEAGWEAIAKASANSPRDSQMRGGTYVWRVDSGGPYLEYFDRQPGDGPLPPAGDGVRVEAANVTLDGRGLQVDPASLTLVLTRGIAVVASEQGHKGLAIQTDPLVTAMGGWPQVVFQESGQPVLSASDLIRIEGAISGRGAITSGAEVQFQGPSILDSNPGAGVSVYARGDITVEAIPREVASLRQDLAQYVEACVLTRNLLPTMAQYRASRGQVADPGLGLGAPALAIWEVQPGLAARKLEQFHKIITRFGSLEYADQSLTGDLVTWGSFDAELGGRGVLHLASTPVARGGGSANPTGKLRPGSGALRLQRTSWSEE